MESKLPKGWKSKKIADVIFKMQTGTTPSMKDTFYYENTSIYWYAPSDFDDVNKFLSVPNRKLNPIAIEHGKAKLYDKKSLLLVAIGATIGKVALIKDKATSNQQITALSFNEKVLSPDYGYYWFKYIKPLIVSSSSAATLPIINQTGIGNLPITYPESLSEQQRIIAKIDRIFEQLDKSIALVEENIGRAKALKASILSKSFSNNWEKKRIKDVLKVNNQTLTPKKEDVYNIVGLENIERDSGRLIDFLPTLGANSSSTKVCFSKGMVLYGKLRPYLNKVYVAEFDGIATTEILPFVCDNNLIPQFVAYYLRNPLFLEQVDKECSGTRMPRVSSKFWEKAEICMPSLSIQQRIVAQLDQLFSRIARIIAEQESKLQQLKAMKASVLDKAFRGEM